MLGIIQGILEQGFIYGIIAMGVYITYSILDFPDLTVDGSFPLGAAVCAVLIANHANPYAALALSFLAGGIAGFVTGIIHVKFKIRDLLSGILTMTTLYSVNLRIAKKSNIQLFDTNTIFNGELANAMESTFGMFTNVAILFIITCVAKIILDWYLQTKSGMLLRACGDNRQVVTSLARDSGLVKILGLSIANALVSLGGGLMSQQQRYFEISMGTGTIVICLASVIIGMAVFKKAERMKHTTAVLFGAVFYKSAIALAISLGFATTDMKMITAFVFFVVLVFNTRTKNEGN